MAANPAEKLSLPTAACFERGLRIALWSSLESDFIMLLTALEDKEAGLFARSQFPKTRDQRRLSRWLVCFSFGALKVRS